MITLFVYIIQEINEKTLENMNVFVKNRDVLVNISKFSMLFGLFFSCFYGTSP